MAMRPDCTETFDPDDGRIAFVFNDGSVNDSSANGIATVNADGSDFRVVVEAADPRVQHRGGTEAPRWAPGDQILFGSNRADGADDWGLWLVSAIGGEPEPQTSRMEGIEYYGAITNDGTLAYGKAVVSDDPGLPYRDAGIFVGHVGQDSEYQLTTAPESGLDEWADISPDGTLVAFSRFGGDGRGGLFVVGIDGAGLRRIIGPDAEPVRPRWSPDGSLITFSTNAERFSEESADVWVVAPDGTGGRKIVDASGDNQAFFPDWAPDGEHLVYLRHVGGSGTQDLAVAALDGTMSCLLRGGTGSQVLSDPDWEPITPSAAGSLDATPASAHDQPLPAPPTCTYGDTPSKQIPDLGWATILLDTEIGIGPAFAPGDLVDTATAGLNGGHLVRSIVVADLRAMADAARAAGAPLAVQSGFRSYQTQEATFAYWTQVGGIEAALRTSARPGHSEHQLGTTLDFKSAGGGAPWASNWAQTDAGAWMGTNAWRFGFVMSYPHGAFAETCYAYEPWHYRYVGHGVAARVRDAEVTLRHWLWSRLQQRPTQRPTVAEQPGIGRG
jgi:D-alanyl-D-alanine carboxypeptidase